MTGSAPREMQHALLRGNQAASSMTQLCCPAKPRTDFLEAEVFHSEGARSTSSGNSVLPSQQSTRALKKRSMGIGLEIVSSRLDLASVPFEQPRGLRQTAPGSHHSDTAFLTPCLKVILDDSRLQKSDWMPALAFERS
jgi:hypothetical protein